MEPALQARSENEIRYYLMVMPCPACGHGHWEAGAVQREPEGRRIEMECRCSQCGRQGRFVFDCECEMPADGPQAECINLTDKPSRIVDLGQWVSLFSLLVESAATSDTKTQTRRQSFQAAMCLAEALKFYGDDELPPQTAFFSDATRDMFREHPERFARQKLRDMQARLPSLGVMAQNVARDERRSRGRWWRFWRK